MAVEDIVGDFVHLKKRGVNLLGLCPFHNEKTPSFTVSPSKNIYKCFGCGKGGNGIDFLMEHEAMSYPEALRYVARIYNIEIEEDYNKEEDIIEFQHREALQIINKFAAEFFSNELNNTDKGKSIGLSYLKDRGFIEKTIKSFELGFAPSHPRDKLTTKAKEAGHKEERLKELGLSNQYGNDFFFDRIIFPIHSLSGKPIAFAGRILKKNVKAPKYLNSPESEIYHKRKVLYGMHLAKKEIRAKDLCFLVEGYTDVMMLHQNNIENVVATSGTSLTTEQIRLIKRYSKNACLIFDGDQAGIKASLRGIDLLLEEGMDVQVLPLPEEHDPDSFIQSVGHNRFTEYFEERAQDFLFYKAELSRQTAKNDPVNASQAIQDLVTSISKIEDTIKRHLYIKETAKLMSVPEELLLEELNNKLDKQFNKKRSERLKEVRKTSQEKRETSKDKSKDAASTLLEKDILRILIQHGEKSVDEDQNVASFVIENISDVIELIENENFKKVLNIFIEHYNESKVPTFAFLTQQTAPEIRKTVIDIHEGKYDSQYSKNWIDMWDMGLQTQPMPDENQKKDALEALMRFKLNKATKLCRENLELIKQYEQEEDAEELMKHLQIQKKLTEIRNVFAKEFKTIVLK